MRWHCRLPIFALSMGRSSPLYRRGRPRPANRLAPQCHGWQHTMPRPAVLGLRWRFAYGPPGRAREPRGMTGFAMVLVYPKEQVSICMERENPYAGVTWLRNRPP